ncbi:hypothetical protein BU16DRAFT_437211, partial [Lophium mytilinum]
KRRRVSRTELEQDSQSPDLSDSSNAEDLQAIFKRAFEAKFKPLAPKTQKHKLPEPAEELEDGDEDSWDGIEPEEEEQIEVVEHVVVKHERDGRAKEEAKAFLSSKPPSLSAAPKPKPQVVEPADADTEAGNLKNDLALQRLLRESHLLDTSNATQSLTLSGSNRHKAIDLRLQSLGSKTSILTQESMPMSHRKGISAKAAVKEAQRRKEAKENGIILETVNKKRKRE